MIIPPVGGTRWNNNRSRHRRNAVLFLGGAVSGATLLGILSGLTGQWVISFAPEVRRVILVCLVALGSLYGIADVLEYSLHVPSRHTLVPRRWGNLGDTWFSFVFGASLGIGFLTIVPFVGFYIAVAWCAVTLSPLGTAAVLATFGMMRGLPVVLTALASPGEGDSSPYMPLGIIKGYSIADVTTLRRLRIASLLTSCVTILASLT